MLLVVIVVLLKAARGNASVALLALVRHLPGEVSRSRCVPYYYYYYYCNRLVLDVTCRLAYSTASMSGWRIPRNVYQY